MKKKKNEFSILFSTNFGDLKNKLTNELNLFFFLFKKIYDVHTAADSIEYYAGLASTIGGSTTNLPNGELAFTQFVISISIHTKILLLFFFILLVFSLSLFFFLAISIVKNL